MILLRDWGDFFSRPVATKQPNRRNVGYLCWHSESSRPCSLTGENAYFLSKNVLENQYFFLGGLRPLHPRQGPPRPTPWNPCRVVLKSSDSATLENELPPCLQSMCTSIVGQNVSFESCALKPISKWAGTVPAAVYIWQRVVRTKLTLRPTIEVYIRLESRPDLSEWEKWRNRV